MQTDTSPSPKTPDEDFYRRGQMRRWGGLLLLVGVVWLVFELTSRGSLFGLGLGFVERSADTPARSFAAARLVVRGASDNISLERAPTGDTITVAVVRHGFGWNADAAGAAVGRLDVKMTQSGDTLQVEVSRAGFAGFIGRSPYVDLRISVPDGVALDVQTVSGDLSADGLRADGSLSTTSGAIDLADSSGALQVQTVSGDITLGGASGLLRVRSISGDIALRDLRDARLDLESTSGDIAVTGSLADGQQSTISNISGGVHVRLPAAADLRLNASTVSGDLSSDLDLRDALRERRSLSGTVGVGKTTLTISTTSGDIEVSGK